MSEFLGHVMTAGFPLDKKALIHLFVGGSQLHGAKVSGYDDLDIYGCYIEPPTHILGLQTMEHFVWSSGSQREKNIATDVDVTLYSLHRWGELIMKGNPAILHYLFADNTYYPDTILNPSVWDTHIAPYRDRFISKKSCRQYLGFANSQRMRLTGERGMGRHGQRPDLIEKYGYDTKFAMHYIRLLYECRELLRDRYLTLPRPEPERQHLIDIRTGKYTQDEVLTVGTRLQADCEALLAKCGFVDVPNKWLVSQIIAEAYLKHWSGVERSELS